MNNKMAVCILAHTDERQLSRLVHSLDSEYFDVFIHLDKKVEIERFKAVLNNTKYSKVEFICNRFNVYWGDISIVDATLEMMRVAQSFADETYGSSYKRYINISGLDYPIKSNSEIFKSLDNDTEFIMGNRLEPKEFHKLECCYFWRCKILNIVSMFLYKTIGYKFKKQYFVDKKGKHLDIYFAPQWHALTGKCVEYVFSFIRENPEFRTFFKHSYAPDELLIPTIVFNSPYHVMTVKHTFPESTHYNEKTAIHYLNYEPVVEVFTEKNYDEIIGSKKLFFRKATSKESLALVQRIEEYRKHEQERMETVNADD